MGLFSYVVGGAGAGLGHGVADAGRDMEMWAAQDERWNNARVHEDAVMQRQMELERMREAARQQGGGRGGSAELTTPQMLQLSDDQLAQSLVANGMTPDRAQDAVQMIRLRQPQQGVLLQANRFDNPDRQDDAGPDQTVQAAKYQPGQAQQLVEDARIAFRRAMAAPSHADDVAKAEDTENKVGLVNKYAGGDDRAGDAAMIEQGKDPYAADAKVDAAQVRADATVKAAQLRAAQRLAGGDGNVKVRSTFVDGDGNRVAVMSDGSQKTLGTDASFQKLVQTEKKNLSKTIENVGKTDDQLEDRARNNVKNRGNAAAAPAPAPAPQSAPPANVLKEGVNTTFKNGQTWTLRGGRAVRVS
jgi:hypothetical protein